MAVRKPEMVRRQEAVANTLKRYRGKIFTWEGSNNCGQMARFQMMKMGHKVPKLPPFKTELGCWKALRGLGFENTDKWLDAQPGVVRINPAELLLGDLVTVRSNAGEMQAIAVCVAQSKFLGWREDSPKAVILDIPLSDLQGAWRL